MKGRSCTYLHESLNSETINLDKYCLEKDIEACAVSINIAGCKICILTIYRSPSSNYGTFLDKLELILQKICKKKCESDYMWRF
jgi:hypothetical protein